MLVLEVINPRPYAMRAVRVTWTDGSFAWASGERLPGGGELRDAVDTVTAALHRRNRVR